MDGEGTREPPLRRLRCRPVRHAFLLSLLVQLLATGAACDERDTPERAQTAAASASPSSATQVDHRALRGDGAAHGAASNEAPREGSRVELRGTYKGPTKAREHIVLDVVVEPGSRWVQCLAGLEHTQAIGNIPLESSIVVTGRPLAERPATLSDCTYTLPPR